MVPVSRLRQGPAAAASASKPCFAVKGERRRKFRLQPAASASRKLHLLALSPSSTPWVGVRKHWTSHESVCWGHARRTDGRHHGRLDSDGDRSAVLSVRDQL